MGSTFARSPIVFIAFVLSLQIHFGKAKNDCEWDHDHFICEWENDDNSDIIDRAAIAVAIVIIAIISFCCCCYCRCCPIHKSMHRNRQGSQHQLYPMGPQGQPAYPQQGYANYSVSVEAYPEAPPPYAHLDYSIPPVTIEAHPEEPPPYPHQDYPIPSVSIEAHPEEPPPYSHQDYSNDGVPHQENPQVPQYPVNNEAGTPHPDPASVAPEPI